MTCISDGWVPPLQTRARHAARCTAHAAICHLVVRPSRPSVDRDLVPRRDLGLVHEVLRLGLQDALPLEFDATRCGPRSISWWPDRPATLKYVEAQDEGDPKRHPDTDPRDVAYALDLAEAPAVPPGAPRAFASTSMRYGALFPRKDSAGKPARRRVPIHRGPECPFCGRTLRAFPRHMLGGGCLLSMARRSHAFHPSPQGIPRRVGCARSLCACRYGGIAVADDDLALLYESEWQRRKSRVWVIRPRDPSAEKQLLFDRNYEDIYSDPGSPMYVRHGTLPRSILGRVGGRDALLMQGARILLPPVVLP